MARSLAQVATGTNRNRGVLMLAVVFGLLSAALMFAFLSNRGGDDSVRDVLEGTGEVQSVLVLARDVEFGETITADMVTEKSLPLTAILPGAAADRTDLVGMVAAAPLYEGEQILPGKLTSDSEQNTLAFKVPPGMRALSLEVPHEAWINAGLPQPGDRVDVMGLTTLVTVDPLTGQEQPDIVAGLIAQNVEVLAVSQSLVQYIPTVADRGTNASQGSAAGANGSEGATGEDETTGAGADDGVAGGAPYRPVDGEETYQEAISVTLALSPGDAARVAIIDAMDDGQGQFRLLTRYQGDDENVSGQQMWALDEVFPQN